jgi:hypothetical protein
LHRLRRAWFVLGLHLARVRPPPSATCT